MQPEGINFIHYRSKGFTAAEIDIEPSDPDGYFEVETYPLRPFNAKHYQEPTVREARRIRLYGVHYEHAIRIGAGDHELLALYVRERPDEPNSFEPVNKCHAMAIFDEYGHQTAPVTNGFSEHTRYQPAA